MAQEVAFLEEKNIYIFNSSLLLWLASAMKLYNNMYNVMWQLCTNFQNKWRCHQEVMIVKPHFYMSPFKPQPRMNEHKMCLIVRFRMTAICFSSYDIKKKWYLTTQNFAQISFKVNTVPRMPFACTLIYVKYPSSLIRSY